MTEFRNLKKEQFLYSTFPYCSYSLDYALDALQREGAEKIEFYGAAPHFCMEDVTLTDMKVLKRKLEERELSVLEINPENCAYPVNLASSDPAMRMRTQKYYENAVYTAGEIGASYVLVFPGFPNADESFEDAWKRSVQSMSRLGRLAQAEGVTITYEATTPNLTVVGSHRQVMKLIQETGCENMGVTVDLMCLAQTKESVQDVYDICGADRVLNVHYTDGALLLSGSWEHRIPGEGTLNLDPMLEDFDRNAYRGYFCNEVKTSISLEINTPEKVDRKLKSWWDAHFRY